MVISLLRYICRIIESRVDYQSSLHLFQAFADAFPVFFDFFVHLYILKLEKNVFLLQFRSNLVEKRQFLKVLFEFYYIFEVTVSFYLIIEKSLQIDTGFIVDKVDNSQSFTYKTFADSSLLQTIIYKLALLCEFLQFLSYDFLSLCLVTNWEIVDHVVNIGNYSLFLHRITD